MVNDTPPSADSTVTSAADVRSWKSGAGGVVRTRRDARTATTSGGGELRSTVIVGVLRCDPRCSTGRLSAATETVDSVVSTAKAPLA